MRITEAVARELCWARGDDPDAQEPGDLPHCDGRGYGNEKKGEYKEPWHWKWREYVKEARAVIKVVRAHL